MKIPISSLLLLAALLPFSAPAQQDETLRLRAYRGTFSLGPDNVSAARAVKEAFPVGMPLDSALKQLFSLGFGCRRANSTRSGGTEVIYYCDVRVGLITPQVRRIVLVTDGKKVLDVQPVIQRTRPAINDDHRNA